MATVASGLLVILGAQERRSALQFGGFGSVKIVGQVSVAQRENVLEMNETC